MGKPLVRKSFQVVQHLDRLKWKYSKEEMLKRIKSIAGVTRYSFIVHNKDKTPSGEDVTPHFDLVICFDNGHTADSVAKTFGVPVQQVEIIKRTTADAEQYLTHLNAPEKYQYDPAEVTASYDYLTFYNNKKADRERQKSKKVILSKIENEEIRPYNIVSFVGIEDYTQNESIYNKAFKYVEKKKGGVNRNMKCLYMYGPAGAGKTSFAKEIAEQAGYSTFVSSGGRNPLDDYGGQDCIILDDLREETFKLNDFLKLTDNHTESLVGCRYYNKSIGYCKLLVVTSIYNPSVLFKDYDEDKWQIYRRFKNGNGFYNVTEKNIYGVKYDRQSKLFVPVVSVPNPITLKYKEEDVLNPFEELKKYIPKATEDINIKAGIDKLEFAPF